MNIILSATLLSIVLATNMASAEEPGFSVDNNEIWTNFAGYNANLFMKAMANTGVTDLDHDPDATNLRADRVDCSAPVVPDPVATCSVSALDGRVLAASADPGQTMYKILLKLKAIVPTAPGVTKVSALHVRCYRPNSPDEVAFCSFQRAESEL